MSAIVDIHKHSSKLQDSIDRDSYMRVNGGSNGLIKIAIPSDIVRESDGQSSSFPRERLKTLVCFLWLMSGVVSTAMTISFVHEWVPNQEKNPPLPDVFFHHVGRVTWAFKVAEVIGMTQGTIFWIVIFFHKHRLIILRRSWLLVGLLYLLRCITMFVTVLPVPDTELPCSQHAPDLGHIIMRGLQLLVGGGLSITGASFLCGDYIFSGHTFMLTLAYLFIKEYTPQSGRKFVILHWVTFIGACVGVVCVMAAHEHYTIDILLAYWIATRMFWYLHTVATNKHLQLRTDYKNYMSREFWFPLLEWSERNVNGIVPNVYEWPLPWPRRLAAASGSTSWMDS